MACRYERKLYLSGGDVTNNENWYQAICKIRIRDDPLTRQVQFTRFIMFKLEIWTTYNQRSLNLAVT